MATNFKGKTKEVNALNTHLKLLRAADSVRSKLNVFFVDKGLTENQFNVLDVLYNLGATNQKIIGAKLLRSGGNITLVIDNLEKLGLVKRIRGKEDRREFLVELEEEGKKVYKKIFPEFLELLVNQTKVLTVGEHKELQRLCKKIGLYKNLNT